MAKGMKLATIPGLEVRPTTDRVKEAIFSIVQFELSGSVILDLFAGSGQMGIEALSRGAERAVFVDQARDSSNVEIENLKKTKLFSKARVVTMNAESFLMTTKELFDIIFMDPPYHCTDTDKILLSASKKTSENGMILCETDAKKQLPDFIDGFNLKKEYYYGRTKITVYRKGTGALEENCDLSGEF